jgi:sugar phosphate isomerase/epimerase
MGTSETPGTPGTSGMRVGLDAYTIRDMKRTAVEKLEWAKGHGLDGVQFPSATELSETLDEGAIREAVSHAGRLGLYLDVGVSTINPHNRRSKDLDAERAQLAREIRAARATGTTAIRSTLGGPDDRFNQRVSWQQQLDDAAAFVRGLAPLLRDLGCRLAIETHGDATTWDLVRLAEATEGATAVLLDTANVLVRVEEPLAAARRAAPHVVATHAKDGILYFDESDERRGIIRQNRPCGQGVVPWAQVLAVLAEHQPDLRLSIEDHRGLYPMPVHDAAFMAAHPDLSAAELGAYVGLAWDCTRRIRRGEIMDPDQAEAIPWEQEQDARIAASAAHLRQAAAQAA